MKTTLLACCAGICLISTLYVTYRWYNLTSAIEQLNSETSTLQERIIKTEANLERNKEEITAVGNLARSTEEKQQPAPAEIISEIYKEVKKAPKESPVIYEQPKKESFSQAPAPKPQRTLRQENYTPQRNAVSYEQPERKAPNSYEQPETKVSKAVNVSQPATNSYAVLAERMMQLKDYAMQNGLDKEYALIGDMGVNTGKKRFYLVNLSKMSIAKSGLMAYSKKGDDGSARVFKVERTGSDYYELYSLDKNGNVISPEPEILSAVTCVPNAETDDLQCHSDGGPGLSPKFFGEIKQLINIRKKPMLLWMFK